MRSAPCRSVCASLWCPSMLPRPSPLLLASLLFFSGLISFCTSAFMGKKKSCELPSQEVLMLMCEVFVIKLRRVLGRGWPRGLRSPPVRPPTGCRVTTKSSSSSSPSSRLTPPPQWPPQPIIYIYLTPSPIIHCIQISRTTPSSDGE